jgi:hypothetical protein
MMVRLFGLQHHSDLKKMKSNRFFWKACACANLSILVWALYRWKIRRVLTHTQFLLAPKPATLSDERTFFCCCGSRKSGALA